MAAPVPLSDLSIIVVTWRSAADIVPLLASLATTLAAGAELIVVDNASGDETPALVRRAVPGAVVLVNAANRGFAAAANQGLAASRGRFVLFLNPDTVVEPDAVARALATITAAPAVGVLGCRTLNADGTPQSTVDRFHTVGGLVWETLWSRGLLARGPRGTSFTQTREVDWVYGSFLLCRREALETVGGFDESYEMYGEDLDLCHRVHAAGFRIVYCAEATIVHLGNRSGARRYGSTRDVEVLKGTLRFFRRRRGRAAERAFRALAGGSFVAKAVISLAGALGSERREARERAGRYWQMAWLCARGDPAAAGERLRARHQLGIDGRSVPGAVWNADAEKR